MTNVLLPLQKLGSDRIMYESTPVVSFTVRCVRFWLGEILFLQLTLCLLCTSVFVCKSAECGYSFISIDFLVARVG